MLHFKFKINNDTCVVGASCKTLTVGFGFVSDLSLSANYSANES
jgi:hypothetical protein